MIRRSTLTLLVILCLVLILALTLTLPGCGGDDADDRGDDRGDGDDGDDSGDGDGADGDTGESLFVTETLAPINGVVDFRARGLFKSPRKNGNDYYIVMAAEDDSDQRLVQHSVSGISDDRETLMMNERTVAALSDYGLGGNEIVGYEADVCSDSFMLVKDPGNDVNTWFVPLTGDTADIVPLDSYLRVYMWVRECRDQRRAQIFGFSRGAVVTGPDVDNHVWKADLWDWDPNRETPWVLVANVMDDLPGGADFLLEAEVAFFSAYRYDYDWGSAMAVKGDDGRLYWLRTTMPADPTETRWQLHENVFNSFNNRNFVAGFIDIELMENLWLVDHVNDMSSDVPPRHICVVGHAPDDPDTPLLWVTSSTTAGEFQFSENDTFAIGFEGPCSVTSFTEAISMTASVHYPWVAYRSAKNELSALWRSQTDGAWWYSRIDGIGQTAWRFASQYLVMGTLGGNLFGRVTVAYDDNDSIRIATCKANGPCGDY